MYVTLCIVHKHLHMCEIPNLATVCRLRSGSSSNCVASATISGKLKVKQL